MRADLDSSPDASRGLAANRGPAAAATEKLGGRLDIVDILDILGNNAGIFPPATLDVDEQTVDRVWSVNLKATFLLKQAVVPSMISQGGGVVIKLGSRAARLGLPAGSLYAATRGAVDAFTLACAAELGAHDCGAMPCLPE